MKPDIEVLIVGAGISGIGAAIACLRHEVRDFVLLESADDLGGTWRDNTYPGIAVDIPSASYSFSFEDDYSWTRTFPTGDEIQRYVRHCAEKYGIASHIRYRSRMVRTTFDAGPDIWSSQLADGRVVTSRFVIAATGLFGRPRFPDIAGLDSFAGKTIHTARWDHGQDLTMKRVAVIGTGASAVQIVPEIAERVSELRVFQRTPIWISPRPDRPVRSGAWSSMRRLPGIRHLRRLASEANLELLTFSVVNYRRFPIAVRLVQRALRASMRRQVKNADTAAKLIPEYGLGCKRPAPSNDYLKAFNRPNVHLVTDPIERICASGIVTRGGVLHEAETIVLATGFQTTEEGNAPAFEVVGTEGVELGRFWSANGRQAYAGVSVPGFPNFFLTIGPYSGGFNWFTMLSAHLDHIMACISTARAQQATRVEIARDVHERYMRRMRRRASGTVFVDASCATANSYYIDRHGEASLALPHTPWWRVMWQRVRGTRGYEFA